MKRKLLFFSEQMNFLTQLPTCPFISPFCETLRCDVSKDCRVMSFQLLLNKIEGVHMHTLQNYK